MPGVNWIYKGKPKGRKFWSISSDYYAYLGQLFIDFDFKFDQPLGERTSEFELTNTQVEFLLIGVEQRIDSLLSNFNPEVPHGLTTVSVEYKGLSYDLYVRMSRNHRLIHGLIKFYNFLAEAISENKPIIFWGGELE